MTPVYLLQDQLRGGGTERQSIELCRALNAADIPASLLVASPGGDLAPLAREQLGERYIPLSTSSHALDPRAYYQLYRRLTSQSHLLICMGRWAHCVRALLPDFAHARTISTVRTSRPLPTLYRRCIRRSQHLLTNSHWALSQTEQLLGSDTLPPASVLHNPLSRPALLDIDEAARKAARLDFGLQASDPILLSVARLEPGKGHADLIRAFAQLGHPKAQLWLLGQGPERAALEKLAASTGLADRIRFEGFCADPQRHFAAADLFLSASTLDSLPNALIEAHAAALPIVSYPSQGIPEIVEHDRTGILCRPAEIETLSREIAGLLQSPERCLEMGRLGRQKIITEFSRETQNARFCELIVSELKLLKTPR